ncbi:Collagen triple helix repeat-containing protein 1 [Stylophora pistillata]|uniref:Collagen triple helix repeat-containing protein 1 n=1 Tax=Stylophora pistillata TaxID=50429 RepID=A0A2B4R9W2_STYPI|nr:Collagen triple helix repeat-containing protein 1 [Stylophora pistillata]
MPGLPGMQGMPGSNGVPGTPGVPGSSGPSGPPGRSGDTGENPGSRGPRGHKGLTGEEGETGSMGEKGRQAIPGKIGPRGYKGSKGETGSKGVNGAGIPGMAGPRGPKGLKVERGIRLKGMKGDAANIDPRQLANWKQCAWNSPMDTDKSVSSFPRNALLTTCSQIRPLKSHTKETFVYRDPTANCNRWYFKFNGNECSGSLPVYSVLYTRYSSTPNILRPHFFEGFCENLPRGTVQVELWVGKCSEEILGNAYSGWNSVSRIMIEEVPPSQ